MNDNYLRTYFDIARSATALEIRRAEEFGGIEGLLAVWKEFEPALYEHAVSTTTAHMQVIFRGVADTIGSAPGVTNDAIKLLRDNLYLLERAAAISLRFNPAIQRSE
jgi:hypothetical protein